MGCTPVLGAAGYRAVAIDVRGYGRNSKPEDPAAYRRLDLVEDNIAVVHALAEQTAVIVGHDWGSTIAASSALVRPDLFRAVGLLSVPYAPRGGPRPSEVFARMGGAEEFSVSYFQEAGRARRWAAYPNLDRDWEDLADFDGAPITQPSPFVGGALDASTTWPADAIQAYPARLPGLVSSHILDACGHWIQQERHEEVNRIPTGWLASLPT